MDQNLILHSEFMKITDPSLHVIFPSRFFALTNNAWHLFELEANSCNSNIEYYKSLYLNHSPCVVLVFNTNKVELSYLTPYMNDSKLTKMPN